MSGAMIGIDPGAVSGAYALILSSGGISIGDLPVLGGQVDAAALSRLLKDNGVSRAVVERVGSMPKQGVASTFKFGFACGVINGVLMANGVGTTYVVPAVWKRFYGSLLGQDKDASRQMAINLWPNLRGLELKKHHGRAEALLMLNWLRANKDVLA